MNQELNEIFKLCDAMFENCTIDYNDLVQKEINDAFFEKYTNVRIVNSFLFNFSKLQDKIGAKLFRKVLYELKEIDDINMPMLDVLSILEKLSIINDSNKWDELREIRNSISHEYPFSAQERIENIKIALHGYEILKDIYENLKSKFV
jgi:hypothetical protein